MNKPASSGPTSANSLTPITSLKNTTVNSVTNTVKNAFNRSPMKDISSPVNESISAAFNSTTSPIISVPIIVSLGVLIILFIIIIMYRKQISLAMEHAWRRIKEWFRPSPPPVQEPSFVPAPPVLDTRAVEKILPGRKEVFNIATDRYTYTDAEPVCKAFGAELATYDQVKEAWKKGADWCNYGWVKGQAAVYPTQQSTYDKLQAGPEDQRMACGVPGINGGYFDNPELRFGVNCYGNKPSENETDNRHTMSKNHGLTPDAIAYDKKVAEYKAHLTEIPVNPFNSKSWS